MKKYMNFLRVSAAFVLIAFTSFTTIKAQNNAVVEHFNSELDSLVALYNYADDEENNKGDREKHECDTSLGSRVAVST